jgi:peptidoglycan/LPS O-acetylase OafA/YrhL
MFPLLPQFTLRVKSLLANLLAIAAVMAVTFMLAILLTSGQKYMLAWKFAFIRVGSEFLIGCLIYNLYTFTASWRSADIYALTTAAGIITLSSSGMPHLYDGLMVLLFAILILSLSRSQGVFGCLLSSRPMLYLGRISYSVYLIHSLIIVAANQFATRYISHPALPSASVMLMVVMLVLTTLAADRLYAWVEVPAREYLRKHWLNSVRSKRNI